MITRTAGRDVELRAFALTDMVRWGYSGLRNIKPAVGEKQAKGIPALHRAVKLRSDAVAKLKLYCWRGDGPTRERVDTVWQSRLFRNGPQPSQTNPVQTRFSFWSTVEESLAWRRNAYVWKNVDPNSGQVVEWWALHPDQVTAIFANNTGDVRYEVQTAPGFVDPVGQGKATYKVGPETLLHIRGHGDGGQIVAPSAIEEFKIALEGPIGRLRHEARMWRRGTALQVALEFPAGVGKEQADQWREVWRSNYEGTEGETTAVIGGGATIKPIGMSMVDAQFVEMNDLTVLNASQIMSVPANLLGYQVTKVRTDLEQDLMTFLRFFLEPELSMIEEALYADPVLFGGSQMQPGFDTANFVRGDLMTEATILQAFVQAGILTANEARHQLGYERDDDPASDTLQVTPVGGAPNAGQGLGSLKPSDGEEPDSAARGASLPQTRSEINNYFDTGPLAEELGAVMRDSLDEQARINASVMRAAHQERQEMEERARLLDEARDERLAAALERDVVIPAPVVNVTVEAPRTRRAIARRDEDGTIQVDYEQED